jgi:hypothetical protein
MRDRLPKRSALLPLAPTLAGLAGAIGISGPLVWEALAATLTNIQSSLVIWTSNLAALAGLVLAFISALFAHQHGYAALGTAATGAALGVITFAYWVWELMRIAATS